MKRVCWCVPGSETMYYGGKNVYYGGYNLFQLG